MGRSTKDEGWTYREILAIARNQRGVLMCILGYFLAIGLRVFDGATAVGRGRGDMGAAGAIATLVSLVVVVAGILYAYRLAGALKRSLPVLYALSLFIPLVGLLVLLSLSSQATTIIRLPGFKVGLLGANLKAIEAKCREEDAAIIQSS